MPAKTKAKKAEDAMTTREVADKMGVDPRALRRYLRSDDRCVGAGKRNEFTPDSIADLKKRYTAWKKATDEAKKPKE